MTSISALNRPLQLPCGAVLPNRLAKAALSEQLATPDLSPSDALVRLYRRWSSSGAGLIVTGNVMIDRSAITEARNEVLDREEDLPRYETWAQAAISGGAPCWLQLNHPGRQCVRAISREPVAPSAVPVRLGGVFSTPRALQWREIEGLIEKFASSASRAQRAGFSGVQIHAAHGYLISQFLSPRTNLRNDEWGGTLHNRSRFLREIVKAVRTAVGARFPVSVKMNSADFQRGGFSDGEAFEVAGMLDALGVDLIEISGGTYESPAMMIKRRSTREREAYFFDFADKLRERVRAPLMLTGGFRSAAGMAEAVASGAIDMVGMARPMILEPDLPRRLLDGTARASIVRPIRAGFSKWDGALELYWYGLQLRRLGAGKSPDPGMGVLPALAYGLREAVLGGDRARGKAPAPHPTQESTAAVEARCP